MTDEARAVILPEGIVTAVTVPEARQLAALATGQTVLELGAFYGYSTIVLASVAELVVSVDWHLGDDHAGGHQTWDAYCRNLDAYGVADRVQVVRGRFEDTVPDLAAMGLQTDGAFIDGHHSAESVARDLGLALTIVRPGGWIAFHDYGRSDATGNPGFAVTEVADRFGVQGVVEHLAWGVVPEGAPA